MQRIRRAVRQATRFAAQLVSVAQILLFLPLTLDIAGKECMRASL